jgi:ABC-2 type transport system ATP-binding protein
MSAIMQAEEHQTAREGGPPIVASLSQISKNFDTVQALRKVDFDIHAGELVALLGPNGAGKTTAVKLLLGLARPTAGTVSVFGGNPIHPQTRLRTGAMLQVAKVP